MAKTQSDDYTQWKGSLIKVTLTTTATLTSVQENVELDSSAGIFTVTLPDITSPIMTTGKVIWFYDNGNAATNNITIIANTGDGSAIDDGDEYIVDQNDRVARFELINNRWMVTISTVREFIVGSYSFTNNATVTTISTQNTFTDIAGTGVAGSLNNGFDFTTSPNTLTSTFDVTYDSILSFSATVQRDIGNAPREISLAVFEDTGSGFVKINTTEVATTMTGDLTNVSMSIFLSINDNNAYKIMTENRDSTDDILVSNISLGIIKLR